MRSPYDLLQPAVRIENEGALDSGGGLSFGYRNGVFCARSESDRKPKYLLFRDLGL